MRNTFLKNGLFLFLVFLISSAYLSNSHARVIVQEKEKFYSVRGKTGAQIYKNILKTGTKVSKKHAIASTKMKFKFRNFKGQATRRNCKIGKVDVIVSLVYTYPKWRGYNGASAASKRNWDKFLKQLKRHEKKHGSIAIETARKAERAIKRSRGRVSKNCKGLADSVIRGVKLLVAKHHRQQALFDKREHSKYSRITRSTIALIKGK